METIIERSIIETGFKAAFDHVQIVQTNVGAFDSNSIHVGVGP